MTETFSDKGALAMWSTPECPFAIEYSRKALDDIRLAVVDAFFSLPRGGAEIGGILLGKVEEHRIQILDYAPIECEHAFGPAFTLSPADQERLGEMLRQLFPGGLRPVGWYHSHTRSEIALSEADLDIHNRHFPERWQVALVLRPSAVQPTQAGFFFREPDGSIHAQNSYHEFVVEALTLQQVPATYSQAVPGPVRETEPDAVVMTWHSNGPGLLAPPPADQHAAEPPSHQEAVPAPEVPADLVAFRHEPESPAEPMVAFVHEPEPIASEPPPAPAPMRLSETDQTYEALPRPADEPESQSTREDLDAAQPFVVPEEEYPKPRRGWVGIAAGILAGVALGVSADQMRSHSQTASRGVPPPVVAQQQAPAPENAALRKQTDDLARQVADLAQQNSVLRKENAELSKQQADSTRQQSELSKQQADAAQRQAELRQQRDDLAKQTAKLKADLTAQTARSQSLQQQFDDLRRQQQRRRLSIQSSDPLP